MIEWLAAIAVMAICLALLPGLLRRAKAAQRKSGASGVMIGIGLAFAMVFDAKTAQATEQIDQQREEAEDEKSGDQS